MIIQQAQEAEAARAAADKALKAQNKLQKEANKLAKDNLNFSKQQANYVKEQDARIEEIVSKPAPPPPPPPAAIQVGSNAGMVTADGTQSAIDSRKKGRAALRIDLNVPQTAGATGLNVPRG